MSSITLRRLATRKRPSTFFRSSYSARRVPAYAGAPSLALVACSGFSTGAVRAADHDAHNPHEEESFEEFSARCDGPQLNAASLLGGGLRKLGCRRYEKEFEAVQDVFELQRNLNNAFAYDLVPSPSVITAALKAARRVNDYPTAVRIFEGIKAKVENKGQYDEYLRDLQPLREELGVNLKEDLYPEKLYSATVDAQGH
ncbi:Cytochrome c oxidase subunit 6 [Acarospora aff. strigata]|nr:Cytochrome c oxidase subunit 6 [Acarospora aff. strigata]